MIDSVLKNRIYLLVTVVILIAGILRFYKIEEFPVSLYWDEVSSAYNAYSIAETGKDEFGNPHPLLFRAFEDYKTPANIYLTAIAVKAFGLNEFSARFTSAFLGTFSVLVTFLLIKEILKKSKLGLKSEYIALITAFLVAISPWHIQFSRTGFEANVGLFFVITGAFFFFKFINIKKHLYLAFSMFVFAISVYFYRSIWVFVPLFLVSLFLIYRKELFSKEHLKKSLLCIFLFVLLIIPFIPIMASREGLIRANQVVVINNSGDEVFNAAKKQEELGGILGKSVYNRRIVYLLESGKGYLAHFSPKFLFFQGDGNGRHGVRDVGVLYLWAIIFIIPGLLMFLKLDKKTRLALVSWILIAVIPAAISVPSPHSLRSLNLIPIPQLIISLGIVWFYLKLNNRHKIGFIAIMIGMILYFSLNYLNLYFGENARRTSAEWGDGYKQLTQYVFENENQYDKVLVSGHYWQPYIYFLFYKKYDPVLFQKSGSKEKFDKYIFGGTSWDMNGKEFGDRDLKKLADGDVLVALSPVEYNLQKQNLDVVKEIKNHNNELVFIIGKLK